MKLYFAILRLATLPPWSSMGPSDVKFEPTGLALGAKSGPA